MTNQELQKAFIMRLNGKTYEEISKELYYSASSIRDSLDSIVHNGPRVCSTVYPRLNDCIAWNYGGMVMKFAYACGIRASTMYALLNGRMPLTPTHLMKIKQATGLTEEEILTRKEPTHGLDKDSHSH